MTYKHRDIVIAYMDGEQIQVKTGSRWVDIPKCSQEISYSFRSYWNYRIKPETRKYRVAFFKNSSNTLTADNQEEANSLERHECFVRWLTDWVDYEV